MQWVAFDRSSDIHITRLALGFVAGFAAVFIFHQTTLGLLHAVGLTAARPYVFAPVPPIHAPRVISSAFWGGVWGILFTLVERHVARGVGYWIASFVAGSVALSLVAWFVVSPLKGAPVAAGWRPSAMITGLLVNGAWGVGTALLFQLLSQCKAVAAEQWLGREAARRSG